MTTRALMQLRREGIPHEVMRYTHDRKGAAFAAAATGAPLATTIKTLVVDCGPSGFVLALVPGDAQLGLKHLARAVGVKRCAMADPSAAERLTGYSVGGISPFGTRQPIDSVMERRLLDHERVVVNAGRRGVMVVLSPQDIVAAIGCRVADLVGGQPHAG
jgi:Cys-tRNA(Pro)/Cys-tRNA(Cys) deacylase